MLVSSVLGRWSQRSGVQGHPQLHSELTVNPGSTRNKTWNQTIVMNQNREGCDEESLFLILSMAGNSTWVFKGSWVTLRGKEVICSWGMSPKQMLSYTLCFAQTGLNLYRHFLSSCVCLGSAQPIASVQGMLSQSSFGRKMPREGKQSVPCKVLLLCYFLRRLEDKSLCNFFIRPGACFVFVFTISQEIRKVE